MNADDAIAEFTSREAVATRTFVQLADTLVDDFDLIELLTVLASRCVELLDASAAGILLADDHQKLRVMAASNEQIELLELFQIQNDEGPCLDCYQNGHAVIVTDLNADARWPLFAAESIRVGFPSVCALPLKLRNQTLGCLNLFMSAPVGLRASDVALAQALADISSIAISQDASARLSALREIRLQHALDSRVIIEQAKGMIAAHAALPMDEAFARLRGFARRNNLALTQTAHELVDGRRTVDEVTASRSR